MTRSIVPILPGAKLFASTSFFMKSCSHGTYMDSKVIGILIICFVAVFASGCTTHFPQPAGTTPLPTTMPPATPAPTASPVQVAECTRAADCMPAECCHPRGCTARAAKQVCNLMCTASCEGPLDCGAGSCGCVNATCRVIPAPSVSSDAGDRTALTVKVSPRRYSPIMSSTPGIGLEPVATGIVAGHASFAWKATYGQLVSWNSPDFRVNQLGDSVSNHGEKLYWSFYEKPSSTATPVTITITATDAASGRLLGSSTVTLTWEGNYSVTVKEVE